MHSSEIEDAPFDRKVRPLEHVDHEVRLSTHDREIDTEVVAELDRGVELDENADRVVARPSFALGRKLEGMDEDGTISTGSVPGAISRIVRRSAAAGEGVGTSSYVGPTSRNRSSDGIPTADLILIR
jgi:hypothetical protein